MTRADRSGLGDPIRSVASVPSAVLEFAAIGKHFGSTVALEAVTFEVRAGEILGVCGQNGAGKSTLINILAGVYPHGTYEGHVILRGEELRLAGPAAAHAAGVALLPQELIFLPDRSVAENVLVGHLPRRLGMIDRRARDARVGALLDEVGLQVPLDLPLRRLDPSRRQLVCIARALALDPDVLILDEPTASLPRLSAEALHGILRSLAARGRTVLYISHHLTDVVGLADRVVVLRNGRVAMAPTVGPSVRAIVRAMVGGDLEEARGVSAFAGTSSSLRVQATVESARYGGRDVLDHVELGVQGGEILGIAGLLGSGAEALLPALAGALGGRARVRLTVDGRPVAASSPRVTRRAGVAYLPADRRAEGLLPLGRLSANVLLGKERHTSVMGLRRPTRERSAVLDGLVRFGVSPPDPDAAAVTLSGGNQQKLLLTRASYRGPRVILLAEPTRGVDVGARQLIHQHMRALADEGAALLVSSSDVTELSVLCDRVVAIWRGRAVAEAGRDGKEAISETAILEAINGQTAQGEQAQPSATLG